MSILSCLKSIWTKASSKDSSTPPVPSRMLDHHGALAIPEIVRHIIVLVLSQEPQPHLLHSSQRSLAEKGKRTGVSSPSTLSWSPTSSKPQEKQEQQSRTNGFYRARDPSSVRLVCKLWYAIWLEVRLCHQDWTLSTTTFNIDEALETMRKMSGRQRVVIRPSPSPPEHGAFMQGVVNDVRYSVALMMLATQLTRHTVQQLQHEQQLQQHRQRQRLENTFHTNDDERQAARIGSSVVVRELCLKGAPLRLKCDTITLLLQHPIFRNITLLDLSFKFVAEFDIKSLFDAHDEMTTSMTRTGSPMIMPGATFYFSSLRHLLLRNIQLAPVAPELLTAHPLVHLTTLVLDGILAPVSTIRDLLRVIRSPMLRRVHVSRPLGRARNDMLDIDDQAYPLEYHNALTFSPSNSMHGILDELLLQGCADGSTRPSTTLYPPPQLESLGVGFMESREYQESESDEWPEMPREPTLESYYSHCVHRDLPTENSLVVYLQSPRCKALRELHAPSVAYDVTPFINSFSQQRSTNYNNRTQGHENDAAVFDGSQYSGGFVSAPPPPPPPYTQSSSSITYSHTLLGHEQYRWHCRNLRILQLSFLSSSSERSLCVQSSREMFAFLSYNCPLIEVLDIQSQWILLTWDSGLCLTSRWRHLQHMVLRGCSLGWESPLISTPDRPAWWELSFDHEWILQHPTKEHVQKRKTSRAMCRELLRLPPFSQPRHRHKENGNGETPFLGYSAHNPLDDDESNYEPGSLASALAPILGLDSAPASHAMPSSSSHVYPNHALQDATTNANRKTSKGRRSPSVDKREGALWEKLRSVRIVTEGFTHTNWRRSQMPWKNYAHSWHHLRPDIELKFTFGRNTPDLLRSPSPSFSF